VLRGSSTTAQVQTGPHRRRHVSDPARDRRITLHPGHHGRRGQHQHQHGRNRMIPALAHPAIGHPSEQFQQVTASIRYRGRHERVCRCRHGSTNDKPTHGEAPVTGICERTPVPTGASSPSPPGTPLMITSQQPTTNHDSTPQNDLGTAVPFRREASWRPGRLRGRLTFPGSREDAVHSLGLVRPRQVPAAYRPGSWCWPESSKRPVSWPFGQLNTTGEAWIISR
jgi:hypothetical protein